MPLIHLQQVRKEYPGGVAALDGIDLEIESGEWVSIMGPSGSGKSTLLNILDGLDHPTSGKVLILGKNTGEMKGDEITIFRRENIGLIFQQFHMVSYLTALENIMLAQYFHSMVDKDQAHKALSVVQMDHRANHLPSQLSGGEQQRVCIARALINDPKIILADEPTGNLDKSNEEKILEIFQELHQKGKTLVVVTHDPSIGERCQRKILLDNGKVAQNARLEAERK